LNVYHESAGPAVLTRDIDTGILSVRPSVRHAAVM